MRRVPLSIVAFVLALWVSAPAAADWGKDINPGAGPALIEDAAPRLAAIVKATPGEREGLIAAYVKEHGLADLEAWKRFRNPELKPLFLALARHDSWKVQHRALYALEYYGGADVLELAISVLEHEERRLREKAVITCIKLWDGRKVPDVVPRRYLGDPDFHVRRCFAALMSRARKKLPCVKVQEEHVVERDDGLRWTPFLSGMNNARKVAPDFTAKVNARQGGGSAAKLPAAARWVRPLLAYGEEVVGGTSLQPFANLRQNGTVYHLGQDVGACMEGVGFYSPADGIVKLVHTGSDMGTLIVVEHPFRDKQVVNGVYMHGGDTVFVKAGERVVCGQLLGTMGMGYSIENGGHFAHLHYGLYPGPFSTTHNYGYRSVKAGLADWHDPAAFFDRWVDLTAPLLPELPPLGRAHAKMLPYVEKGQYGRAYAVAVKARDAGAGGRGDPDFVAMFEAVPGKVLERVDKVRAAGYPADALRQLKALAAGCKGIAGAEALAQRHAAWAKDPAFKADLKAEKDFLAARKKAAKAKDKAKRNALWQKLLDKHGDTALAARIKEELERS
jgi:murein DD-endopeptidase MepM/ murein hydrolase activator NlpD